ncbi:MAG: hypothetical protein JSS76_14080 [Bacteroidetes bacterium]|nr:hypothetical protein [Bacteroidota bacterium]
MEITGEELVQVLKKAYGANNNAHLAKILIGNSNSPTIGNWAKKTVTKKTFQSVLKKILEKEQNTFKGKDFIQKLKAKHGTTTDIEVAALLGVTPAALPGWKKKDITIRMVVDIIEKAKKSHADNLLVPIVEFYPLCKTQSLQKTKFEIVDQKGKGKPIREELISLKGIYIFYDSMGKAIYSGKAKDQSLWAEMNNAYNRPRKYQEIKRVSYLKNGKPSKNSKITNQEVKLHDIASYFTAYSVEYDFIDKLEAALIRMFSNDLLNKRSETI